uniref:marginal zone B- and B1-cell-specific protein-like n=1 Tax=Styela clava TaxID=7725 RepID=UPI0019395F60|nr:marginal zone B- and B1-cell-specific protein-like [Styela clava]
MQATYLHLFAILLTYGGVNSQTVLSGDPSRIPPNPHKKDKNDPQMAGSISMGTPDLSDEDSMSIHMPNYLKCDACRIIAFRFADTLEKEIDKFPSIRKGKKELSEDRVLDLLEGVCDDSWEQYGIKEVEGVNRLSGPGFETSDIPGIMQGGGKWPFRFKQMCQILVGDVGEEIVYETFRKSKGKGLEKRLCFTPIEGRPGFCEKKSGKEKKFKNAGKPKKTKNTETEKPNSRHNEL